jgi:hypothetical protein
MATVIVGTPAVGVAPAPNAPQAVNRPEVYVSEYTEVSNALVVGDKLTGVLNTESISLVPTTPTSSYTLDGVNYATLGETTYGPITLDIAGPNATTANSKTNMLVRKSEAEFKGMARAINLNIKNPYGDIDRMYCYVLSYQAVPGNDNTPDISRFVLQPFGIARHIKTVA